MIEVGQTAPDFAAPCIRDDEGDLLELFAQLRSHTAVVLAVAPGAFVPPCTAELVAVQAAWGDRSELAVIGLFGDGLYSLRAYAREYGLEYPLVSDFHGSVADSYGLRAEEWDGHSQIPRRATVVIDDDWTVRAVETAPPLATDEPAPAARVTDALEACGLAVPPPTVRYDAVP